MTKWMTFSIGLVLLLVLLPANAFAASKMPAGTKVASLLVEKKTEEEIRQALVDEILIWQAKEDFVLVGDFETIHIPREVFQFDLDDTIAQAADQTKRSLATFFRRPKDVYIPLTVTIDREHEAIVDLEGFKHVQVDQALQQLERLAGGLEEGVVELSYQEDQSVELDQISQVKLETPDLSRASLQYMIEELDGVLLRPGEIFSLLESIESAESLLKSRDELSFIASGLYHVFLQSDLEIVSRHPQRTQPPYGMKGINADLDPKKKKDLIVYNDGQAAYRIHIEQKKDETIFSLEGKASPVSYEVISENERSIKPRTIYRYSKKLKAGEQELIQAGKAGLKLDVIRSTYENDIFLHEEVISQEIYLPQPRIVLLSPDEELEEESTDQDTEDMDDLAGEEGLDRPIDQGLDSITGRLPDNLAGNDLYEEVKETESVQERYQDFLDNLLEIYTNSLESTGPEELERILQLQEKLDALEEKLDGLLLALVEEGLLTQEQLDELKGGAGK